MTTETDQARGWCYECGQWWAVRTDGNLRTHGWTVGKPGNCPGSHRPPSPPPPPAPDPAEQVHGIADQDWGQFAACIGYDPEVFFRSSTGYAKRICAGCTVREQCLDWSLGDGVTSPRCEFGVYGGLDEKERRSIVRRRSTVRA